MISNARNPKWTGIGHQSILIEVEIDGEWVGFVASPTDVTEYGPMLFNFAANGVFGEVAASDEELIIAGELPPPRGYEVRDGELVNIAQLEWDATAELNRRLATYNSEEAKARAEVDDEYAAERKAAITVLLAVKTQPGWPSEVEWPD